jgi:hypothetical protein
LKRGQIPFLGQFKVQVSGLQHEELVDKRHLGKAEDDVLHQEVTVAGGLVVLETGVVDYDLELGGLMLRQGLEQNTGLLGLTLEDHDLLTVAELSVPYKVLARTGAASLQLLFKLLQRLLALAVRDALTQELHNLLLLFGVGVGEDRVCEVCLVDPLLQVG